MQPPQEDIADFPLEICLKPQPLIGMSGLDIRNNAMHKLIADTFFNNRRIDGIQIQYKLIDNTFSFPAMKPKRNSYEWYVPKGILKRNWMHKHLNCIPAVIAVFYELDWNDLQFSEKSIECASRIQSLRHALEGRNTKIALVLMQSRAPMPSNDDVIATERAATLCSQCGVNTKMLFVLPHGDHLQGYAVRLENTFYELAQGYYTGEAKIIKGHREHLNKTTHQYLMVRHQFKMGFLNELKQDIHAAHKHYTHAYNNLLEIRIVDTNANEIRTVAGFVNYKLCRLMFALNLPRDAISQFKSHTERFKMRLGFVELSFEHYAWLSKQFSTFGDIFDEAVKMGLPAVQTQHPGLYYQQAVNYANMRKKKCLELSSSVDSYPTNDPLIGIKTLEFYGQRPWRPGKVSQEPPDPQIERNGIEALQFLEKNVNHSNVIIGLYGLAVAQFKTYKCPRTRRHLVVQMADEYFTSGDYGKSLTLLTHMLLDYRTECWWSILAHIVERALISAYLIASIEDFVVLSLELLGKNASVAHEKKKHVYENLVRILSRQSPIKDPSVQVDAKPQWDKALAADINMRLDMNNITTCIDCKCRFMQNKYQADDKVHAEVYVRNECDFPMKFSKIGITVKHFNEEKSYFVQNDDFFFKPGTVKRFIAEFTPQLADINNEISICAVDLHLGESGKLVLQFTGTGNKCSIPMELKFFRKERKEFDFDNVYPNLNSTIVPRNSMLKLSFTHAEPALLGEWYEITIHLRNEEKQTVSNMEIEIGLVDDEGIDNTEFSRTADGSVEKLPIAFQMEALVPSFVLHMRAHKIGDRNLYMRATFVLDGVVPSLTETTLQISVVKPFEITTRYLTGMFEETAGRLYVDEVFVAMPVINCLSPWPIRIEDTKLECDASVRCVDAGDGGCQIAGAELKNGESVAEMYLATTAQRSDGPTAIGQYTIKWRRCNGPTTTCETTLMGPSFDWVPLEVTLNVPAHGLVRTPMLIEYHLINKSSSLLQIDANIEGSEAFMFAGFKQFRVSILPGASKVLTYNLYPLIAGSVCLPKLVLTLPENDAQPLRQEQLNALLQRSLPTHIFVMPQKKGNPTIPKIMKGVAC